MNNVPPNCSCTIDICKCLKDIYSFARDRGVEGRERKHFSGRSEHGEETSKEMRLRWIGKKSFYCQVQAQQNFLSSSSDEKNDCYKTFMQQDTKAIVNEIRRDVSLVCNKQTNGSHNSVVKLRGNGVNGVSATIRCRYIEAWCRTD